MSSIKLRFGCDDVLSIVSGRKTVKTAILAGGLFFFVIVCKVLFDMAFYEVTANKRRDVYETTERFIEQIEKRVAAAQRLIDGEELRSRPNEVLQQLRDQGFTDLSFYGRNEELRTPEMSAGRMVAVDDQYAFQSALQGKTMIAGKNDWNRHSYIIFYVPYQMREAGAAGVMVARMDAAVIHNLLKESVVGGESYDFILDFEGDLVHDSSFDIQSMDVQTDTESGERPNEFLVQSLFYDADMIYFYENLENSSWRMVKAVPAALIYREILDVWILNAGFMFLGWIVIVLAIVHIEAEWRKWRYGQQNQVKSLTIAAQAAAGIAHEIKNPLTSIKGFLALMIRKDNPSFIRRNLPVIMEEVQRIESLSNQFCLLARPQKQDEYGAVDLAALIWHVVELVRPMASERDVQLTCAAGQANDGASCVIHGNANQLTQVVLNILKNALEATARGGSVAIMLYQEGDWHCIRVKDTGQGICPENLQKIGTPFYTTKENGTGLGLLVSFEIIQRHGGEIQLRSVLRVGTEFIIKLPLHPCAAKARQ